MTPKDKAIDLIDSHLTLTNGLIEYKLVKKSALITVDEIIKALPPFTYGLEFVAKIEFWNNVKQEIENL
jgi:hypothetical protein